MVRYRVTVSGRVQGVFFRDECRRRAVDVGVNGWIRNTAEGTVEAVLEGEQEAVERVVAWMKVGPRMADVSDVDVEREEPAGERSFRVR